MFKRLAVLIVMLGAFTGALLVHAPGSSPAVVDSPVVQRVEDYETHQELACGSSTRTGSVNVFLTRGTTTTLGVTNQVSLGSQVLWWQITPVRAYVGRPRPVATYVQFLVSPGVWHLDVTHGANIRCAITKL